ncbi:MAG: DUF3429 domain-containing protein [Pseudomonadota bacterium]
MNTSMPSANRTVPASAAWLGGLGAIPFVSLAAGPWFLPEHAVLLLFALKTYGAVILSFLGGVHWGLAMARSPDAPGWGDLTLSVAPSLVAWPALLLPGRVGFIVLAAGVFAMLIVDLQLTRRGLAPAWYPGIRTPLSLVVTACLILGSVAS